MSGPLKIFVDPNDPRAQAFESAVITHPSRFVLVDSEKDSDTSMAAMLGSRNLASLTARYLAQDSGVNSESLRNKTIEISIEVPYEISPEGRVLESEQVLESFGISKLDSTVLSMSFGSTLVAGTHLGSHVSIAHRTVPSITAWLQVLITDLKEQIVMEAPLNGNAQASRISRHSETGTQIHRPVFRSAYSRFLAEYR